jgi:hypothetical protein
MPPAADRDGGRTVQGADPDPYAADSHGYLKLRAPSPFSDRWAKHKHQSMAMSGWAFAGASTVREDMETTQHGKRGAAIDLARYKYIQFTIEQLTNSRTI